MGAVLTCWFVGVTQLAYKSSCGNGLVPTADSSDGTPFAAALESIGCRECDVSRETRERRFLKKPIYKNLEMPVGENDRGDHRPHVERNREPA